MRYTDNFLIEFLPICKGLFFSWEVIYLVWVRLLWYDSFFQCLFYNLQISGLRKDLMAHTLVHFVCKLILSSPFDFPYFPGMCTCDFPHQSCLENWISTFSLQNHIFLQFRKVQFSSHSVPVSSYENPHLHVPSKWLAGEMLNHFNSTQAI